MILDSMCSVTTSILQPSHGVGGVRCCIYESRCCDIALPALAQIAQGMRADVHALDAKLQAAVHGLRTELSDSIEMLKHVAPGEEGAIQSFHKTVRHITPHPLKFDVFARRCLCVDSRDHVWVM